MKELSDVFKNQETSPLNRAVFNIEQVIKYKNLDIPMSPARNLNLIQIYLLDVIGGLLFVLCIAFYAIYKTLKIALFVLQPSITETPKKLKQN